MIASATQPSFSFTFQRVIAPALVTVCVCLAASHARADDFSPEAIEFFETDIRPLLVERCSECHGSETPEAGLQLVSREMLLAGGDSGTAFVAGEPDQSLLIRAVEYLDEPKMPPDGKLPDGEIAKLREWIAMGAPWPATDVPVVDAAAGFQVTEAQAAWWAFQPVSDPPVPTVMQTGWPGNEIDHFILSQIESHGMQPAAPADRAAWLRRATFDLTGLPPTLEELDAYLADESPNATEAVIDRLLASPAYGQRWARHWLDVARYADYYDANPATRTASCEITEAWRYRDWVVDALNNDLPFDQFIVHQIAGDLLPSPTGEPIYPEGLIATTFLTNGVWDRGDADKEKIVSDMADDNIDIVGKAFMGLTLGCARCHDHKFDPISNEDYYGLAGIFYSSHILADLGAKGAEYVMNRTPLAAPELVAQRDAQLQEIARLNELLAAFDAEQKPADDPERVATTAERDQRQAELIPEFPLAIAMREGGTPGGLFPNIQDVPIHIRGSYTRLGAVVPRRMPRFFAGHEQPPITDGSGRLELAHWVASANNPLTARVIVNRVWQWHFGAGLVATPNNFGLLSEPPSHPELLDWLAVRFIEDGWSLKQLHHRIMLSSTYQQSSIASEAALSVDPENRWLSRFTPRRLEAEALRDAMLFVNGRLDQTQGGPAADDLTTLRRSLYIQTARWDRGSYAILFDAANPDASVATRDVSIVTPQSLFLLNHPFVWEQAGHLADRLISEVPEDADARIGFAWRLLYSRPPSEAELTVARQLVEATDQSDQRTGWVDLAHILLCSNEFVYID